ncbi:MAG TPA: hypothetical protein VGF02_12485 [Pseudolabrys sp.]|jgi:hypothetical protein
MIFPTQRLILIGIATLTLAGCANGGGLQGAFSNAPARPKTIMVSDFVLSSDVAIVDRGYTARLERKVGQFPTFERKPRTIERVNDEIVASIVATLREAGFDAQPGNEDALTLRDEVLLVTGRIRPSELSQLSKGKPVVFGSSRVSADMTLSTFSGHGKKQLLAFSADTQSAGKPPVGKQATARNTAIAEALAAQKAPPEKLSPDIEAPARRLGRAVGEKIVAYAKEQGWTQAPTDADDAQTAQQVEPEQRVQLPEPKPTQRSAKKPPQGEPPPDAQDEPDEPAEPKN